MVVGIEFFFIHGWFIVVAIVHLAGYLESARKAIDAI
jgi:hypothetical protein